MEIKNLSDLTKIAALCRKKGIETIKITAESVEFKLAADLPSKRKHAIEKETEIKTEQPTAEQMLFWSSQGLPDDAFEGN